MPGSAGTLPQITDRDHAELLSAAPVGKVPPEWQDRGKELIWSWRDFGPPDVVARARRVKALAEASDWTNRKLLPGGVLSPRAPEWEEYLRCAEQAMIGVVAQLSSGVLFGYGSRRRADADPVWIPDAAWAGLRPDRGGGNTVRGPGVVYHNVRVISAEEWLAAERVEARAPAKKHGLLGGASLAKNFARWDQDWAEAHGGQRIPLRKAEALARGRYSIKQVRWLHKRLGNSPGRPPKRMRPAKLRKKARQQKRPSA
jgi:hypothetical protein